MGEHGETEREVSRVEGALLDSVDGDRGPSKVKFALNMLAAGYSWVIVYATTDRMGVDVAIVSWACWSPGG